MGSLCSSWPGIAVRRTACCRTPMSRPSTPSRDAIPSDVDRRHKACARAGLCWPDPSAGHDAGESVLPISFCRPCRDGTPSFGRLSPAMTKKRGKRRYHTRLPGLTGWPPGDCNGRPASLYNPRSRLRLTLSFRLNGPFPRHAKSRMRTHANGSQGEQRICAFL